MPQEPRYDEKELFSRIAQGDEGAFTELFHLPFIVKLTRDSHLAQEMIQETFLRLWKNRNELSAIDHPSAWIYRIASNVSLTYLKTQSNRKRLLEKIEPSESTEATSDVIFAKELNLIIQRAVNLLPERRQEIYRLSREQGLSHQEIAEKLRLSINTVKNQIGISLKFIQEFINKETSLSIITLAILFGL